MAYVEAHILTFGLKTDWHAIQNVACVITAIGNFVSWN